VTVESQQTAAGMAIPDAVVSAILGLDSVAAVGVGPR
jgi:hypothetical protein